MMSTEPCPQNPNDEYQAALSELDMVSPEPPRNRWCPRNRGIRYGVPGTLSPEPDA
jgi:hypothetical protein